MQELHLFIDWNNRSGTFWRQEPREKINKGILGKSIGYKKFGFPGGSDDKESARHAGDPGSILGQEDPLEKGMATHSSNLAWKIPSTEEPGSLQLMGSQESDPTEWLTNTHKKLTIKSIIAFAVCKLCLLIVYINKHLSTHHRTPVLPVL